MHHQRRPAGAAMLLAALLLAPTVVSIAPTAGDGGAVGAGPGPAAQGSLPEGARAPVYANDSSNDLPLGAFSYPAEPGWRVNLTDESKQFFGSGPGVLLGDVTGDGTDEIVFWGPFLLRVRDGRDGSVLRDCRVVPRDEGGLDTPGLLYLANGLVACADADSDGREELLLVGEPTGEGASPGFRLWAYDAWDNVTDWSRAIGPVAPAELLAEDLDGDGGREVLYAVTTGRTDDYVCLDGADGRVLWQVSRQHDWDNRPGPLVLGATGTGRREVYLGARYVWKPGGGTGDIQVRFLDTERHNFTESVLPHGASQPRGIALAQVAGDFRPELLAFMENSVRAYDLADLRNVLTFRLEGYSKGAIISSSAGDVDGDGLEEVAFRESVAVEGLAEGSYIAWDRVGLLVPSKGAAEYSDRLVPPVVYDVPDGMPLAGTVGLFRGIPWGGLACVEAGNVSAYGSRDMGALWRRPLAGLVPFVPDRTGVFVADLDGDRLSELLVVATKDQGPGWMGVLEPGEPRVKVLSSTAEGRTCYATYADYNFAFDVVPKPGTQAILAYSMLVPDEPVALMSWSSGKNFANPKGDWVRIGAGCSYRALPGGGGRIVFSLNFTWACDLEEMQDVILRISFEGGIDEDHPFARMFRVENDLKPQGALYAVGSNGRRVEQGGWVRADERLTLRGLRVSYEGVPDLFPPVAGGHVEWTERGMPYNVSVDLGLGKEVAAPVEVVEGVDLGTMGYTLTVDTGSSASARIVQHLGFQVDGLLPVIAAVFPSGPEPVSSRRVTVGIAITDVGSGPDPARLECSYRPHGEANFTRWAVPPDLRSLVDDRGRTIYFFALDLPDGDDNDVRMQGYDWATNGPVQAPVLTVSVSTGGVEFPAHGPTGWTREDPVNCTVRARGAGTASVSGASVEYRWGTAGPFSLGAWRPAGLSGEGASFDATARIALPEGVDGYVQWRAGVATGGGPWVSDPFQVRVDRTPPAFGPSTPGPGTVLTVGSIAWSIELLDSGSGVDGSTVEGAVHNASTDPYFRLVTGVASGARVTVGVEVELQDGRDNLVQARCRDLAGNGLATSDARALWADLLPVAFHAFSPPPLEPQDGPEVTVEVNVTDWGGSGVDLSTVEYATWPACATYWGFWRNAGLVGVQPDVRVQVAVTLAAGRDNLVRFRANDAVGTREVWSDEFRVWVNGPPSVAMSSPAAGVLRADVPERFCATVEDPEGDPAEVTWWLDNSTFLGRGASVALQLPAGDHTVTAWADDGHGHNESATRSFYVEPKKRREEGGASGSVLLAVVALTAVAVCIAMVAYALVLRRRRVPPQPPPPGGQPAPVAEEPPVEAAGVEWEEFE